MLTVEEINEPLVIPAPNLTDAGFEAYCERYPDSLLEYTAEGDLLVMPPTDEDTGYRNASLTTQLMNCMPNSKAGRVVDSSTGFKLPSGARRSPDAAWISRDRSKARLCPEFVVELLSPSDRVRKTHAKMLEWIENGAELGWMVNPRNRSVTVYRPGREPEVLTGIREIAGEGPVAGFVLDLRRIWDVE